MSVALELVLRAAAVGAVGWWCLHLCRGRAAAARHRLALGWLLAATLGVAAASLLPRVGVPLLAAAPVPSASIDQVEPAAPAMLALFDVADTEALSAAEPSPRGAGGAPLPGDWPGLITWLWGAGTALLALRALVSRIALRRLAATLEPIEARNWRALVRRLGRGLGLRRPVRLLAMDAEVTPAAFGTLRPTIILPRRAASWRGDRLACVLTHELAHLRRGDPFTRLVAELCCAAFWFLPHLWLLEREARAASERAADDVVLRRGARPSRYASLLLGLRERLAPSRALARPAACFAAPRVRPTEFEERLEAILDADRPREARRRPGPVGTLAVAAGLAIVVLEPAPRAPRTALAVTPARAKTEAPAPPATEVVALPFIPVEAPTEPPSPAAEPNVPAASAPVEVPATSRPRRLVNVNVAIISLVRPAPKRPARPAAAAQGNDVELLARERHGDYLLATYSFEHATRDDRKRTGNDWDLQLKGHRAPYSFDVTMTGGDRSRIIDLGPVPLDEACAALPFVPSDAPDRVAAVRGHTYAVHTIDSNSDHVACFHVTELTADGRCRLDWRRLSRAAAAPDEG